MASEYWKGGTLISVLTNQASSPLALCIQSMMDWLTLWFLEGDILHGPMRTALVEMGASCIPFLVSGWTALGFSVSEGIPKMLFVHLMIRR